MHSAMLRRETAMDAQKFFSNISRWDYGTSSAQPGWREQRRQTAVDAARNAENLQYAFDAASGSGLGFLASQFELPEVKLVEPLASVTHARDIPIKTGGGFVEQLSAWAANYSSSANNEFGLQDNKNVDIGIVQVDVLKGTWPTFNWAQTMRVSYIDLQRLIDSKKFGMPAPYSLQQLLDKGIRLIWNKALDKVTYSGWGGQAGLIANPAVPNVAAANNAANSSALWTNKSNNEILKDINTALLYTQSHSGYDIDGMADTILLDYDHWNILNNPMTTGGFNSVLEYVLQNNVARRQGIDLEILPLPNDWISTKGFGGANQLLAYRKSEESLYLKIPQPIQKVFTVPSVQQAAYETLFMGCIGVVQWLRPTTAVYLYGI